MEPHDDLQEKRKTHPANDEIDLGPVINWVNRQLQKLGTALAIFFAGILHFFWLIILVLLLGAGAGYFLHSLMRPVYFSDITLSSSYLSDKYFEDLLLNLELFLMDENYDGLAKTLDIPTNGAQEIKKIELLPRNPSSDTLLTGMVFRIVVSVHDPSVYEYLGPKLVNYLGNNDFAERIHRVQLKRLKSSVDALEREISQLDSLKRVVEMSLLESRSSGGIVFMEAPNPIEVYEERNKLFQMQQDQEAKYDLSQIITIVDDFTPRTQPNEPQLLKFLKWFLEGALIVALVLTTVLEVRRRR